MELQSFLQQGLIFSLPNANFILAWDFVKCESSAQNYFYFPNFFTDNHWKYEWRKHLILSREEAQKLFSIEAKKPDIQWKSADKDVFTNAFNELQKEFTQKRLSKGVPVTFEEASFNLEDKHKIFLIQQLLQGSEHIHSYGIWGFGEDLFGFSPELLFQKNNTKVKTLALAGTRDLFHPQFSEKEFIEDPKESIEHKIVVNSISEDLREFGKGVCSDTYVWKLKKLAHLRTDIDFEVNENVETEQIINKLHPTPALGVYPKNTNSTWLKSLEKYKARGRFGAPFFVKVGELEKTIVCIRNLIFTKGRAYLWSGCGVVPESDLDKEWLELENKRQSVKGAFSLL